MPQTALKTDSTSGRNDMFHGKKRRKNRLLKGDPFAGNPSQQTDHTLYLAVLWESRNKNAVIKEIERRAEERARRGVPIGFPGLIIDVFDDGSGALFVGINENEKQREMTFVEATEEPESPLVKRVRVVIDKVDIPVETNDNPISDAGETHFSPFIRNDGAVTGVVDRTRDNPVTRATETGDGTIAGLIQKLKNAAPADSAGTVSNLNLTSNLNIASDNESESEKASMAYQNVLCFQDSLSTLIEVFSEHKNIAKALKNIKGFVDRLYDYFIEDCNSEGLTDKQKKNIRDRLDRMFVKITNLLNTDEVEALDGDNHSLYLRLTSILSGLTICQEYVNP